MTKRKIKLAVLSDIHLGTYGCQAQAVHSYLKSIDPEILVLNGDIIDIWQFSKRYWPDSHMKVVQRIFKMLANGTKVYYLTGNHDELLRKFTDFELGNLEIKNKLVLNLDGKKAWIFHGDVFDFTMKNAKWIAKLGAVGYDTLIMLNALVNYFSVKMGRGKVSLSKKIKNSVKQAITFINDFEQAAIDIALENEYDYVVCGHIHKPAIRIVEKNNSQTTYLNSGDWIENLTALEYHEGKWELYTHPEKMSNELAEEDEQDVKLPSMQSIYEIIVTRQVAFNT